MAAKEEAPCSTTTITITQLKKIRTTILFFILSINYIVVIEKECNKLHYVDILEINGTWHNVFSFFFLSIQWMKINVEKVNTKKSIYICIYIYIPSPLM